jgi:hypothetical protein
MNKDIKMDIKRTAAEEYTHKTRGAFIDEAIKIEDSLTDIIAWCFFPSKDSEGNYYS